MSLFARSYSQTSEACENFDGSCRRVTQTCSPFSPAPSPRRAKTRPFPCRRRSPVDSAARHSAPPGSHSAPPVKIVGRVRRTSQSELLSTFPAAQLSQSACPQCCGCMDIGFSSLATKAVNNHIFILLQPRNMPNSGSTQSLWIGRSVGYNVSEVTKLRELVTEHCEFLKEKWHEHFGW